MHQEKEYKDIFRFNKSDAYEKYIYKLYNLASKYGVHGHQTRDIYLSHLGEVVHGKFIRLFVPERNVLDALTMWLASFLPLHIVAGRTFSGIYDGLDENPLKKIFELENLVIPIINEIKENVKNNYQKSP